MSLGIEKMLHNHVVGSPGVALVGACINCHFKVVEGSGKVMMAQRTERAQIVKGDAFIGCVY
jgi:hypothetical protein